MGREEQEGDRRGRGKGELSSDRHPPPIRRGGLGGDGRGDGRAPRNPLLPTAQFSGFWLGRVGVQGKGCWPSLVSAGWAGWGREVPRCLTDRVEGAGQRVGTTMGPQGSSERPSGVLPSVCPLLGRKTGKDTGMGSLGSHPGRSELTSLSVPRVCRALATAHTSGPRPGPVPEILLCRQGLAPCKEEPPLSSLPSPLPPSLPGPLTPPSPPVAHIFSSPSPSACSPVC